MDQLYDIEELKKYFINTKYQSYWPIVIWIFRIKNSYKEDMSELDNYQLKVLAIYDSYILYRWQHGNKKGTCPRIDYALKVIEVLIKKDFSNLNHKKKIKVYPL